MIHHLLVPALLVLGSEPQARFHPSNADIYVEVGDVSALVVAYEKAPLMQMLRDPATGKIADVVKEAMGFDLRGMAEGMLPVADAQRPDDRLWPWSALQAASISVSELDAPRAPDAKGQDPTRGWFVMDFRDVAAAEQAVAALKASGRPKEAAPTTGEEHLVLGPNILTVEFLQKSDQGGAWIARDGTRILGGFGTARAQDIATRFVKPETSFLAQRGTLVEDKDFPAASGTVLLRAWSDLEKLPTGIDSLAGQPVNATERSLADTFLPAFLPFVGQKGRWRLQLCGDRFVSDSLVERIGAAKELDALYGRGEIPLATARMVPKEAVGAWVLKTQPAEIEALLERALSGADSPVAVPVDAHAPKLSAALGESAAVFLLPLSPGTFTRGATPEPPVVCAIELLDGAAFQTALETWVVRARAADPRLKVENKPYRKQPVYTFSFGTSANDNGGAVVEAGPKPTLTILADRVLLTMSRKQALAEIRRLETPSAELHPIAAEGAIPKGAFEASTMDWGLTIGKLYDAARGLLPMLNQGREKPIDVESLPSSAQLFRFFRPSTSYSSRLDGKTYTHNESSFGPEVPVAVAAMFVGVVGSFADGLGASIDAEPTPLTREPRPAEAEPAVESAESTATLRALRSVRTGLSIYKAQHARVPSTLDELVKGTPDFPKGFLETSAVPKDGWGHALVYGTRDDGSAFDLRSMGANGVDDHGGGDDVSLP